MYCGINSRNYLRKYSRGPYICSAAAVLGAELHVPIRDYCTMNSRDYFRNQQQGSLCTRTAAPPERPSMNSRELLKEFAAGILMCSSPGRPFSNARSSSGTRARTSWSWSAWRPPRPGPLLERSETISTWRRSAQGASGGARGAARGSAGGARTDRRGECEWQDRLHKFGPQLPVRLAGGLDYLRINRRDCLRHSQQGNVSTGSPGVQGATFVPLTQDST